MLTVVYLMWIMSLDLIKKLARDGSTFTIDQAAQKIQTKKEIVKVILSRLEKRGFIERIEKGKYLIIPLDSVQGKYTLRSSSRKPTTSVVG